MHKPSYIFCFFFYFCCLIQVRSQELVLERLPEPINTHFDEITPIILSDGKTIFFTRVGSPDFDKTLMHEGKNLFEEYDYPDYFAILSQAFHDILGGSENPNPIASLANQDIWKGSIADKSFSALHLSYPSNNALPNSLLSLTPDPSTYYVLNRYNPDGSIEKGISYVQDFGSSWSYPTPVEIEDFYTITSEVSISLSYDGKYMLMSARREDSQDLDLYVCFNLDKHKWSAPKHLGGTLNGALRETSPSLSEDNKTLYFTSNRGKNGDNDIFFSTRMDDTWVNWSEPKRLAAPINSDEDDGQAYFNMATGYLYFVSRRTGDNDIFRVKLAPPQPMFVTVQGRVLNEKTGAQIKNATIHYTDEKGVTNSLTSVDGTFKLNIPRGIRYSITAEKTSYSMAKEEVFFKRDSRIFDGQYILDLSLSPFGVDEKIVINPIYFLQSKATILDVSLPEIDRLAQVLTENPNMHIRIEGHTDNLGKVKDLQKLSEDRAEALKQALRNKGISGDRIEVKGFGGSRPVADNETDDQRKKNRRVEIIITKI